MSEKHTPEPWEIYGHAIHKDGEGLAYLNGCSLENARRIVACVNACARMPDPEKEIAALRKELVAPIMVQTNRLVDSLADLTAQRDELLAALRVAQEAMRERRAYCSQWENKYSEAWDAEDKQVQDAIGPTPCPHCGSAADVTCEECRVNEKRENYQGTGMNADEYLRRESERA